MTDPLRLPEGDLVNRNEGDDTGNWFKDNWKAIGLGLLGVFALMSGGMEMLLLGLLLVAAAAVALARPETYSQIGDAISGFWNRRVEPAIDRGVDSVGAAVENARDRVGDVVDRIMPDQEQALTVEQLRTPEAKRPKLSQQEAEFEAWALDQVTQGKIAGTQQTNNLQRVLNEMRDKGEDGQNADLKTIAADDDFINGLPEELKAAAKEKLEAISPTQ